MNNNDFDLENMRQQMTTLKNKLNQQEIINDRLMRRSMRNEVNTIARRYYVIMAVGLLMVHYGYWCFVKLGGLSISFWIVTSIFMLVCAGATYYTLRKINDPNMMNRNLVEARKKVASAKKFEANWLFFGAFGIQVLEKGEKSIEECIDIARKSIDSGSALKTFNKFVELNS